MFNFKKNIFFIVLLSISIFISSCSPYIKTLIPEKPLKTTANNEKSWIAYQKILNDLKSWDSQGLIGLQKDNTAERFNYVWKQSNDKFDVQLFGALGLGLTYLKGSANYNTTLIDNKGKKYSGKTAGELLYKLTGYTIPIDDLVQWSKGLPVDDKFFKKTLNNQGMLQTLEQNGWYLEYKNYKLQGNKFPLPGKIILKKNNLKIIMVISKWNPF